MRSLQTKDLFSFCRVVKEIGIKEELKSICMKSNNMNDVYEAGFELMFSVLEKATSGKSEKALITFFADIFEEDYEAVATSDPVEFLDKLMQVAEPEKWKAFFSRVASLMQ